MRRAAAAAGCTALLAACGSPPTHRAAPATAAPATAAPGNGGAPSTGGRTIRDAVNDLIAGYGDDYALSSYDEPDIAVDHVVGSGVEVDVYTWTGTALVQQGRVTLGADGSTGSLGAFQQGRTPITDVRVTGAATPDFSVTTAGASVSITSIVSDVGGTWAALPFRTPQGTFVGVPSATVSGALVTATFDDCTPTCAQGGEQKVTFGYGSGAMVPVG